MNGRIEGVEDVEDTPAAAMLMMADSILGPLRAAVLGHRAVFIEAGIGHDAADEMAADAHSFMTGLILHDITKGDDDQEDDS